jgi:ABC-2 type transport system ATP-binding protein
MPLRNLIGVQLQTSGLPANMTCEEAVRFFCAYHDAAPRFELLNRLGLNEKRRSQYHQLSIGQQRRLTLTLAAAHNPPVINLDEPTAGLDVASRSALHALMAELKVQGTTILLATHNRAEAEKVSDRVSILLRGRFAALDTPREITAAAGVIALALAIYLFRWDSQNRARQASPLLALLVLLPYLAGILPTF